MIMNIVVQKKYYFMQKNYLRMKFDIVIFVMA